MFSLHNIVSLFAFKLVKQTLEVLLWKIGMGENTKFYRKTGYMMPPPAAKLLEILWLLANLWTPIAEEHTD